MDYALPHCPPFSITTFVPRGHTKGMCIPYLADPIYPIYPALLREVEANVPERNENAVHVNCRFTTQDARRKLARLYPRVST